jgi:hypothetical protein
MANKTTLSYKYNLNVVLDEHDIKIYLTRENEATMKFDKPITTILPDTSMGQMLICDALKNEDEKTKIGIQTNINSINFYLKKNNEED